MENNRIRKEGGQLLNYPFSIPTMETSQTPNCEKMQSIFYTTNNSLVDFPHCASYS